MLTAAQITKARGLNPIWHTQLSGQGRWPNVTAFTARGIIPDDPGSKLFAEGVAAYQAKNNLTEDGICGPMTATRLSLNQDWEPPAGSDFIWMGGKKVILPGQDKIVTQEEPGGLAFKPDYPGTWLRTEPVKQIVIHCKGAEGNARGTWSWLKYKGYGVHGSVERDGRVWQYCDFLDLACAHAGLVNQTSIGFEVTNQMYPTWYPNPYHRPVVSGEYIVRDPSKSNYGKPWVRKVQGFLPAQIERLVTLITTICDETGIPKVIPGRGGKVWAGLLPGITNKPTDWKSVRGSTNFRGVIGHLNVTNKHVDPSPDIFEALLANGFSLQEV